MRKLGGSRAPAGARGTADRHAKPTVRSSLRVESRPHIFERVGPSGSALSLSGKIRRMASYAGIGSRRAPRDMLILAERLADCLRAHAWTLRSGHAPGMDQAFEAGAGEDAEVYLPWPNFEPHEVIQARYIKDSPLKPIAFDIASSFHPTWYALPAATRRLQARNSHEVLGRDLDDPVGFVVCWTPDGSLDGMGPDSGGTGQALRIAAHHGIPVFNLARPEHRERIEAFALVAS